jgi:hypothetical protein
VQNWTKVVDRSQQKSQTEQEIGNHACYVIIL